MTVLVASRFLALAAFKTVAATHHRTRWLQLFMHFGLVGLFLVSIVDSSFVPLPIPGVTDIMVIVLAARHINWVLLVVITTIGSAIGGYLSHKVGHTGGMAFLQKKVPPRIFNRLCHWMEGHAILSVALPAILPPPMPLSPFVLAAGALNMSRRKFMTTFTISRLLRHAAAAWVGILYGPQVLHVWSQFSTRWATTILILLWSAILISCAIAFYRLYKTSHAMGITRVTSPNAATSPPR